MRFRTLSLSAAGLVFAACSKSAPPTTTPAPTQQRPNTTATPPQTTQQRPTTPPPSNPTNPRPDSTANPAASGANQGAGGPGAGGPGGPGANNGCPAAAPPIAAGEPNPRPYATIDTPRAKSKTGVFGVHQVCSQMFFEIPASE